MSQSNPPEVEERRPSDRDEYLTWARRRAIVYLPEDPFRALGSLLADLAKHPGTEGAGGALFAGFVLLDGSRSDPGAVRRIIEKIR